MLSNFMRTSCDGLRFSSTFYQLSLTLPVLCPWHWLDQAFGLRVPCLANHLVFIKIINLTQNQISVGWGLVDCESVLGVV